MTDAAKIGQSAGLFRASVARTGKWAGAIGVVGGFVADILNPLAPFAAYISLIFAVAALIIAVAIAFRLVLATKAMPALVFSTVTAAIAGGVYSLQQANEAQEGVIASLVPAIASLQESMGVVAARVETIDRKVTETQKSVEDTRQSVDTVKQTTDQIAANQQTQQDQVAKLQETTERVAGSIDTIAKGFAALASQGGVIADAKRPDEFYHNARVQELGGDMLNARRSYLSFASFDVDAIDPYLRFATLLRVQDGRSGAREVFGELANKGKAPSLKLVHLLQFDDDQRRSKLNDFIAANENYGPAYYLLAQEFSEDRIGAQSLADKRSEASALTKFISFEPDGNLVKHFVDQTELSAWLDKARNRLASLGDVLDPARFAPTLTANRSNQGWMLSIGLPEAATAISWRLGADGAFADTGKLAMNDQRTGKPMPNPAFEVPSDTPATDIAIKYVDQRGQEAGPFVIRFDPATALIQGNKSILDQFWTSWIAFDASGNRGLVYFTHMLSYRCAIKEVRYSLNGAGLDKTLKLPPCNEKDPYALPDGFMPYFKVADDVTSMSVQVTYADGSQSEVREFRRQ